MARIDVAVLGRPHVVLDGVPMPLIGRQLALAVRLAIARHGPVPPHRLADVWPESNASDGAIRVALTRLRQSLGPNSIVRVDHGYVLTPSAHLDADRFERLLAEARDASVPLSARRSAVDEGLALWAGSAYEGIERLPWVEYEAIRLDEMREHAFDVRYELAVEAGDHDSIIGELAAALARTPERERRCELLALALYRGGRQSAALDVINGTRRRLRDELGLDVGDGVTALERRILLHDPSLTSTTGDSGSPSILDPRIRAAAALLGEGIVDDALLIADAVLAEARTSGDRRNVASALLVKAQAVTLAGRGDANSLIDEAQAAARSLGHGRLLARAALVRFGAGVPPDRTKAMIELGEPLDLLPASAPERIELLCAAAVIVAFLDLDTAADRILIAARRTYESIGDARSEAVWLAAQSIVGSVNGDGVDTAAAMADRSFALAREIDDPATLTAALHAVLRAAYDAGDLTRVDGLFDELEAVSRRAVLPFGMVRVHLCRITNAMARGELADVPALIERADSTGRRMNTHAAAPATQSQMLALAIENDTLHEQLDMLRATSSAVSDGAVAALAAYAGDVSDLQRLRDRLPEVSRNFTLPMVATLSALAASRHGDVEVARWARPHLAALGDRTVVVGFGTVVMGFAHFYVGLTDRVLGALESARDEFSSAVESSDRAGGLLWAAHARLWLAETLVDIGGSDQHDEARRLVEVVMNSPGARSSRRACDHALRLRDRLADDRPLIASSSS